MKTLLNQLLLLQVILILASTTYCQMELKTGVSGSYIPAHGHSSELGAQLEFGFIPQKIFSAGLYGSYANIFSYRDKHYILSTGAVFEWRFQVNDKMKIIPLINFPVGYSSEYEQHYYKYGDYNQHEKNINRKTEGISAALRFGFVTNFETTGDFQLQFDIGFLRQSMRFELFKETEIAFFQSRLLLVYGL